MLKGIFGVARGQKPQLSSTGRPVLETLEDRTMPATAFAQINLISDVAGTAQFTDPNLHNPWGLAVSPTGDFWVANAGTGTVTLYSGDVNGSAIARVGSVITTPMDPLNTQVDPSGAVFNSTRDFNVTVPGYSGPAQYIVAGLDGTLTAISPTFTGAAYTTTPQYAAQLVATTQNAAFTGVAIGSNSSGNFVYAANFSGGQIDVFNSSFQQVTLGGSFTDPALPAGFMPFNIANVNGTLFVTYKSTQTPDVGGVVDRFDTNGNFLGRFANDSNLNAPWAVVQAPAGFGSFGGDILIGNFGDGHINAYDPNSGAFQGQLTGPNGQPLAIQRLWQLSVGNGTTAGNANTVYFTSGLNNEQDGLFGSLMPVNNNGGGNGGGGGGGGGNGGSGGGGGTGGNPSANQQYVSQLYADLLGRQADAQGMTFFTVLLDSGNSRQQVVNMMEASPEYHHIEVNGLYRTLLHRQADSAGLSYWSAQLAHGATFEQVASQIAGSQEFLNDNRAGGTNSGFLAAIYQDALGRSIDANGLASFNAAMQNGATATQVAAVIFASDEFKSDRVQGFYASFLGHSANQTGLQYWVGVLDKGSSDQFVIAGILASNELFAKLGSLPNILGSQIATTPTGGGMWY